MDKEGRWYAFRVQELQCVNQLAFLQSPYGVEQKMEAIIICNAKQSKDHIIL